MKSLEEPPYNGSPLSCRLPPELRVKILRYLLKSDQPIPHMYRDTYVSRWSDRKKGTSWPVIALSSQVLRTCQQLHNEGAQVLYKENTLEIHLTDHSVVGRGNFRWQPGFSCTTLQHRVMVTHREASKPGASFKTLRFAQQQIGGPSESHDSIQPDLCEAAEFHIRIGQILNRFQHLQLAFELSIKPYPDLHAMKAVGLVRDMLIGKHVIMRLYRFNAIEKDARFSNFEDLRCRSFMFDARNRTTSVPGKPVYEAINTPETEVCVRRVVSQFDSVENT